ncbi:MAG: hypothetical protein ASARMPRED_008362 [Alectoria sarmentosa]|nr:MAG: hypothetical protein ASARMPRED_008362 [Alectoria sarmentosa]
MKFTKSKKEPKKSPEEEYAEHISSLTESELRDLHKDVKIDHYGNSTAAVINTASGVGLLSMRSTTRRYRTECMQIEAMEARMKEMGWTAHPTRYRDAVPIALGVAAGTTAGMSFGLINVEKNAKRTKDYVKKTDWFKTKELVETKEVDTETDEAEEVEEVEVAESSIERTQALETTTEHVVVEHSIARKSVPAAETEEAEVVEEDEVAESSTECTQALGTTTEHTTITEATSVVSLDPATPESETHPPSVDAGAATTTTTTEPKTTKKKAALFSQQVSVMNKKMRGFHFKKDREDEKETTVSVTEIAADAQSPADAVVGHGVVDERLDSPPMYASEAQECVA